MRHTRAHTANRRSHHALKGGKFSPCPDCGAMRMPHRVCYACGKYRGRQVIDVMKKVNKKAAKAKKEGKKEHEKEDKGDTKSAKK